MGRWGGGSHQGPKDTWRGRPVSLVMEDLGKDTWVPDAWTSPKKAAPKVEAQPVDEKEPEQISFDSLLENAFERSENGDLGKGSKDNEIVK